MGSYISVGIVYSNKNICKISSDLCSIIQYMLKYSNNMIVNYPEDEACEKWIEKSFQGEKGLYEAFNVLNIKELSTGKISCKIYGEDYHLIVSIRGDSEHYRGFLFEIPEDELLKEDYSFANLKSITNQIIKILLEIWNYVGFDYAFIDNEADIEYQLVEIEKSDRSLYSVLLKRNESNKPIVQYGTWCIDGTTTRE